jgi:hypothetical protein
MEPRKIETPVQSHSEGQSSPLPQSERKRRFQIVKLEERIAPGGGGNSHNFGCNNVTHDFKKCSPG